ncbi:DUF998 domain-containing protein [Micromonospora sp. NBC_01699]|uniref:DUF998 domain-containing protein n=1 Tax=Micromonospora sp. NBC_01699 TaxID=2975984 RepID=UPI002E2F4415|nr:DUF998 domain-containing protein [Micromonospora sp. NBC_01699]
MSQSNPTAAADPPVREPATTPPATASPGEPATASPGGAAAAGRGPTGTLLAAGVAAGPVYVLVSVAQMLTRDGFDPTRHAWSLLANGGAGWIQATNLIVTGLLVVAGAVGLRRTLDPGRASTWAPRLLGVYGLGLVGGGIFRADPAQGFPPGTPEQGTGTSWHGLLHFGLGGVGFVALVAACLVLARRFAADGRPGWAIFSRLTGAVFLAGFVAVATGAGSAWATLSFTASIVLAWAWLSLMSAYHRAPVSASRQAPMAASRPGSSR